MTHASRKPFDLVTLAPNGLRRGYTTGTCATAAVKAALAQLLRYQTLQEVEVSLPDPDYFLIVPVRSVSRFGPETAQAEVVKFAGDDPDCTDGATIFAEVSVNHSGEIRFIAGPGVGTVTQPGIRVPVGEPAINPVPRQMMRLAVDEILEGARNPGFDLTIGCVNGKVISKKTFNPRLGITDGISILGTSGIVEPLSLDSWIASIEVYLRVALGDHPAAIAITPGKIGKKHAHETLHLPAKEIVQIANFFGLSLNYVQKILDEERLRLGTLWVLGHPGKIAKVLDGVWDTHSGKSGMAMRTVASVARACGFYPERITEIEKANTVENIVELLRNDPSGRILWMEIERQVAGLVHERTPRVDRVEVRLFSMNGTPIGEAA
ncbi:MAG: cobalt-precorrin-5B (C(1))-methyltransferase CbiD [Burkholderiales bacterium]|nr:cobalamin biosynthesis protein CbiD [Ferrovum sp.]